MSCSWCRLCCLLLLIEGQTRHVYERKLIRLMGGDLSVMQDDTVDYVDDEDEEDDDLEGDTIDGCCMSASEALLANRTNGHAYVTVFHPSVICTECTVAKRCILEQVTVDRQPIGSHI